VTAEHVREVEELYDELKTLMLDGAAQHVYPVHSNFHLALLPGASHWDRQVLDQLWTATERYIQLYVLGAQRDPASTELILQAHAQLVDVIRNPTPSSLRAAVIDHIQLSHDLILPLIQDASGHA
jgi:DNA-binding FadR family transcriptional regulator